MNSGNRGGGRLLWPETKPFILESWSDSRDLLGFQFYYLKLLN